MNRAHLITFFWLRWRLAANQGNRQGLLVRVLSYILWLFLVLASLASLAAGFVLGNLKMATLQIDQFMYIWDGLVISFLFFWLVGLLGELQRSDILSLGRFLYLPVTPYGAFLINYLGSSASLTAIVTFSFMSGITIGLLISIGSEMLILVPLVASFFLMMTAVTYQFRGWLASMMITPKRRQAVVGILSMVIMAVTFLPALIGLFQNTSEREAAASATAVITTDRGNEGKMAQAASRMGIRERPAMTPAGKAMVQARIELANSVLPPGWLALGAVSTLQGRMMPAFVTMLGMLLIGSWSLLRSYRTTMRVYKGEFDSSSASVRPVPAVKTATPVGVPGKNASYMEIKLPWISEQASAIALAGLKARIRTNQAKFMLIFPVILLVIFSGFLRHRADNFSEFMRPLTAAGISAFIMFSSMTYIVGNMFAYDRGGFRVYMLSSAARRDVLLGRNLSLFPIAFSLMLSSIIVVDWFSHMRADHLLAVILQIVPLYFILCIYGNLLSIYMPMAVKSTGLPAGGQNVNILVREITGLLMLPVLTLTFIPLGIEYLISILNRHTWFPAYLFFILVETGLVLWIYSFILNIQAEQLYRREQRILEVVTARVD